MRVIIQDDYDKMSKWTAYYIMNKINLNKDKNFVLGLPTGSTPLGVYKNLIDFYKKVSFKNVITLIWMNMLEFLQNIKKVTIILCIIIFLTILIFLKKILTY